MKKIFAILVLLLGIIQSGFCSERLFSWDFSQCEIKDIVFAVSLDTGISIACDDTVNGLADFKFAGRDFEVAFDSFLRGNRLFVLKEDDLWTVSRMKLVQNGDLFCLDACDLAPGIILEKISLFVNQVITFETLPAGRISVHFKDLNLVDLLESLAVRFGSYDVENSELGFNFVKKLEVKKIDSVECFAKVKVEEGKFLVDGKNCRFFELVEKLFNAVDSKSFCLMAGGDVKINRICFEEAGFEKTLEKLCCQNGFGFLVKDGVYYVFQDLVTKENLLFGERNWCCFNLEYYSAKEFASVAVQRIGKIEYFVDGEDCILFARVNEEEWKQINCLKELLDVEKSIFVVNLRYIRPEELFKHLPPSVDKSALFMADDDSCIYFKGTESAYKNFCEQIKVCDRPEIRLSYDLLILQYDQSLQDTWCCNFSGGTFRFGERNSCSGILGSVLNFNLNVLFAFGLEFASSLQGSMEQSKASVFADTTLYGVNGKPISFSNTSTYRYRDNNLDPETGKPVYSGVTREIVSGIQLEIVPWVSGDGLITTAVTASISRQGMDSSASTGNPPPTTEKMVSTEVCCRSGEPVILSGLIQNALTETEKGAPVIGKLPLFRRILNSREKDRENSQMVIFLVPRIDGELYEENFIEGKKEVVWCERISGLLGYLAEK